MALNDKKNVFWLRAAWSGLGGLLTACTSASLFIGYYAALTYLSIPKEIALFAAGFGLLGGAIYTASKIHNLYAEEQAEKFNSLYRLIERMHGDQSDGAKELRRQLGVALWRD